jgi:hypothetical protein
MVKCGVFFAVRTEYFKYYLDELHASKGVKSCASEHECSEQSDKSEHTKSTHFWKQHKLRSSQTTSRILMLESMKQDSNTAVL